MKGSSSDAMPMPVSETWHKCLVLFKSLTFISPSGFVYFIALPMRFAITLFVIASSALMSGKPSSAISLRILIFFSSASIIAFSTCLRSESAIFNGSLSVDIL